MRSDPEQEDAWRDEVRAFRRAVQGLANPALPLFEALTRAEEYVARLIVRLPLTTFSPFDALPDGALDEARKPADPIPRPGRLAPGIGARTVSRASDPTPPPARPSKADPSSPPIPILPVWRSEMADASPRGRARQQRGSAGQAAQAKQKPEREKRASAINPRGERPSVEGGRSHQPETFGPSDAGGGATASPRPTTTKETPSVRRSDGTGAFGLSDAGEPAPADPRATPQTKSPPPATDGLASSMTQIGRLADALLHQTEEGAQDRTGRSSDAPDSSTPRRSLDAPERSSEESASSARRAQAVVSGRIGRSETRVPLETPRAEAPGMPGSSTADSPAPSPDVFASSSIEHIGRLANALLHQTEEGAQDRTTSGRSSDAPASSTPRRSLDAPEHSSEESASSARRAQAVVSGRIGRSETRVPLETPRAEAPGMPGSSTADSPAPSPDVFASSSIEHIGRLADALLHQTQRDAQGRVASTPTRPAGSPDGAMATGPRQASPATGETARPLVSPRSREPELPRLGAFGALTDDRAEHLWAAEKTAAPGATPPLVATGEEHVATFAPAIDPDTLATLVNDILVEQARRHGVDLS